MWAECLFVDPISDLAVLGPPDNQELPDQAEKYEKLTELLSPISVADAKRKAPAWLRNLNGEWFRCTVEHANGSAMD